MRKQSYRFLLLSSVILSTLLPFTSSYGARQLRQTCDESPGSKYHCASDLECINGTCELRSNLIGNEKECRDKIRAKAGDKMITPSHFNGYCFHKCDGMSDLATRAGGPIAKLKMLNKLKEYKSDGMPVEVLKVFVKGDATQYIEQSIDELNTTITEAKKELADAQAPADEKCLKCSYCFKISN